MFFRLSKWMMLFILITHHQIVDLVTVPLKVLEAPSAATFERFSLKE